MLDSVILTATGSLQRFRSQHSRCRRGYAARFSALLLVLAVTTYTANARAQSPEPGTGPKTSGQVPLGLWRIDPDGRVQLPAQQQPSGTGSTPGVTGSGVSRAACNVMSEALKILVKRNLEYLAAEDKAELLKLNNWIGASCQGSVYLVSRPEVRDIVKVVMSETQLALKLTPVGAESMRKVVEFSSPALDEALNWFRSDAIAGKANALDGMGRVYQGDAGHSPDYAQARLHFERAAALKLPRAYGNLGLLYQFGQGTPRDVRRAWDNFHLGIEAGDTRSGNYLNQWLDDSPQITAAECRAIGFEANLRRFIRAQMRITPPADEVAKLIETDEKLRAVSADRFSLHLTNGACYVRVRVYLELVKQCYQSPRPNQTCPTNTEADARRKRIEATDMFCRCYELLKSPGLPRMRSN